EGQAVIGPVSIALESAAHLIGLGIPQGHGAAVWPNGQESPVRGKGLVRAESQGSRNHPFYKRLRGEVPVADRQAGIRSLPAHRKEGPPVRGEHEEVDEQELAGPLDIQAAGLPAGRRVEDEDFALVQNGGESAAVGGKGERSRLAGEFADGGKSL